MIEIFILVPIIIGIGFQIGAAKLLENSHSAKDEQGAEK
jgi:hypothetical protein